MRQGTNISIRDAIERAAHAAGPTPAEQDAARKQVSTRLQERFAVLRAACVRAFEMAEKEEVSVIVCSG